MRNPLVEKLSHFVRLAPPEQDRIDLISTRRLRHIRTRQDIVPEGERPETVTLILAGWACRYKVMEDGRRQIIGLLLPGDLCDHNVFVLRHMDHSIGAITDVTTGELSRGGFDELKATHPRVAEALTWDSLVAMATQREWALTLGQRNALERLAHLFCEAFVRLKTVGLASDSSIDMPLTQTELGEATGLSPVHVNRTLQELRAADLIILRDRRLTIPDFNCLARVGQFDASYLHLEHEGRHLDAG